MAWNDKIGLPESRRKSNLCGACVSVWCCGMCCDLGCCVPLTCQFAVELLQEAGLSGVAGEKSKADWVGTRLMVDLCLCGGGGGMWRAAWKGCGYSCAKLACTFQKPWWLEHISLTKERNMQVSTAVSETFLPFCTLPWSWLLVSETMNHTEV